MSSKEAEKYVKSHWYDPPEDYWTNDQVGDAFDAGHAAGLTAGRAELSEIMHCGHPRACETFDGLIRDSVGSVHRCTACVQEAKLRAELDKVREALKPFRPSDSDAHAYKELGRDDGKPRIYPIRVTDHDLLRVHALLPPLAETGERR
jgi:hypothetical protein